MWWATVIAAIAVATRVVSAMAIFPMPDTLGGGWNRFLAGVAGQATAAAGVGIIAGLALRRSARELLQPPKPR